MTVTDVAVVGFAHAPHVRRTDGTTNGVEMLMPCFAELYADLGIKQTDIGFWCSGSSDYLAGRAFSFISAIDSIGAVPPINESHVEMDAAWALYEAYIKILTGAGRHRAGLRLRQVLGGHPAPRPGAADRPVHRRAAVAGRGVDRPACRPGSAWTPGKWTAEQMAQVALDAMTAAPTAPTPCEPAQSRRRAAGPAVLRRPAAPPRHRADHRRRGGDRAGRRRQGPRAAREPGLDHRYRAPHRDADAGRPRPDHLAVDGGVARRRPPAATPARSTSPSCYAPFTHQQLILRRGDRARDGVDEDQPVRRRAGRQPDVLGRPGAHRLRRPAHLRRLAPSGCSAHATSGAALQQNLVARHGREELMAGQARRGPRHRADQVRRQAQGRLDERPVPRGDRPGARRRRTRRSTTSTPSSSARRPTSSRAS